MFEANPCDRDIRGIFWVIARRQTINAIVSGRYSPSLALVFKLARLFDQPIDVIFEPEGLDLE